MFHCTLGKAWMSLERQRVTCVQSKLCPAPDWAHLQSVMTRVRRKSRFQHSLMPAVAEDASLRVERATGRSPCFMLMSWLAPLLSCRRTSGRADHTCYVTDQDPFLRMTKAQLLLFWQISRLLPSLHFCWNVKVVSQLCLLLAEYVQSNMQTRTQALEPYLSSLLQLCHCFTGVNKSGPKQTWRRSAEWHTLVCFTFAGHTSVHMPDDAIPLPHWQALKNRGDNHSLVNVVIFVVMEQLFGAREGKRWNNYTRSNYIPQQPVTHKSCPSLSPFTQQTRASHLSQLEYKCSGFKPSYFHYCNSHSLNVTESVHVHCAAGLQFIVTWHPLMVKNKWQTLDSKASSVNVTVINTFHVITVWSKPYQYVLHSVNVIY